MDVIFSIFKWFVQAVQDVVGIIASILYYTNAFYRIVYEYIPEPIYTILMVCISAYVIIKIKRLVF